jgi:hypothetical protein
MGRGDETNGATGARLLIYAGPSPHLSRRDIYDLAFRTDQVLFHPTVEPQEFRLFPEFSHIFHKSAITLPSRLL